MSVTAFLSMWISNTATAAMMLPIAQAVLQEMREQMVQEGEDGNGGDESGDCSEDVQLVSAREKQSYSSTDSEEEGKEKESSMDNQRNDPNDEDTAKDQDSNGSVICTCTHCLTFKCNVHTLSKCALSLTYQSNNFVLPFLALPIARANGLYLCDLTNPELL